MLFQMKIMSGRITMKSSLVCIPLLLAASFAASADDVLFRPRASLGYASYELKFTGSGGGSLADSSYLTGGFGATIAKDNLYFDLAYNTSLSASYDNFGTDDDFKRTDLSLTAGLALDGGVTVFAGYKTGKSEYTDTIDPDISLITFEASGLFFGAGLSNSIDDNSTISFNAAIALLNGDFKDNDTFNPPFNASADTVGFSIGAGYNYFINNNSGIGLKGSYQYYNFVDWTDANYPGIPDTAETLISIDVSYFANF
jgi:hypothetical protein